MSIHLDNANENETIDDRRALQRVIESKKRSLNIPGLSEHAAVCVRCGLDFVAQTKGEFPICDVCYSE